MSTNDDVQRKGKGHPHLTPLEVQAITNARANGVSIKTLTTQFNVSRQTIYNAIKASKEGRVAPAKEDAPLPEARRRAPRVTPALRKVICDWKQQYPAWGVAFLRRELLVAGYSPVSQATIYKILREAGLAGRHAVDEKPFKRFSMTRPGQLYQVDLQGRVLLPGIGAVRGVAVLDDYSRFCPALLFFADEKLTNVVLALNLAIQRYGVPEAVYIDNGPQFRSRGTKMNNFELFCAAWGIKVVASTPYRPQGKGKVERFFRTVETQFLARVRIQAATDPTYNLVRLNKDAQDYLRDHYHARLHGTTGKAPADLFATAKLRPADGSVDVAQYLERSSARKVNKFGEVSYEGYKIQVSLPSGTQVVVVETIESLRIERAGDLVRVVDKVNLTREAPIQFQDGVGERNHPAKQHAGPGTGACQGETSRTNLPIVQATPHRWGHNCDAEGFHRRKVMANGFIKFNSRLYAVGAARMGETVLVRESGTELFIHDASKVLIMQVPLGSGQPPVDPTVKGGCPPPCSQIVEKDLPGVAQSRQLPKNPLDVAGSDTILPVPGPGGRRWLGGDKHDAEGYYRRYVNKASRFCFAGKRYHLSGQSGPLYILVRVEESYVTVYSEDKRLLQRLDTNTATPCRDEQKRVGQGFFLRKVNLKGAFALGGVHYYVSKAWAGKKVWVLRGKEVIHVYNESKELIKKIFIKDPVSDAEREAAESPS